MNGPVTRLHADLTSAGIAREAAASVAGDYACALRSGTAPAWEAFYRALHAAVCDVTPPADELAARARRSLHLILTDDLGAVLFPAPALVPRPRFHTDDARR
jgi:hypothetical protein